MVFRLLKAGTLFTGFINFNTIKIQKDQLNFSKKQYQDNFKIKKSF